MTRAKLSALPKLTENNYTFASWRGRLDALPKSSRYDMSVTLHCAEKYMMSSVKQQTIQTFNTIQNDTLSNI